MNEKKEKIDEFDFDELMETISKMGKEISRRIENREPYDETLRLSQEVDVLINIYHKKFQ